MGLTDWVRLGIDGTAIFDANVHSTAEAQAKYGAGSQDISGSILQSTYDGAYISFGTTEQSAHVVPFYQANNPNDIWHATDEKGLEQFADAMEVVAQYIGGFGLEGAESTAVNSVVDEISESAGTSTSNIAENAAQGKAFEKVVTQGLEDAGHTDIAEQVTVKPNGTNVKVRLDNISKDTNGDMVLTDAKSSQTAGFTPNQKVGYPAIEKNGGTVVGNAGAEQGYPAGTKIPPTKVNIVRPQ